MTQESSATEKLPSMNRQEEKLRERREKAEAEIERKRLEAIGRRLTERLAAPLIPTCQRTNIIWTGVELFEIVPCTHPARFCVDTRCEDHYADDMERASHIMLEVRSWGGSF